MNEEHKEKAKEIEPGMIVEATAADLGEEDVSKPKVTDVIKNEQGDVEKVMVKKGVVFSKAIEVPVERIKAVENTSDATPGKVVIAAKEPEVEAIPTVGSAALAGKTNEAGEPNDWLDQMEEFLPTDDGLRQMEERSQLARPDQNRSSNAENVAVSEQMGHSADGASAPANPTPKQPKQKGGLLQAIGPGFLGGMSGNDSTAVTAYAVDGAKSGYGHLWLMLLATPLLQAVLFACAKIGRITQKGFADILRQNYGRKVALPTALVLIVGNIALLAGDLVAVGSGLELITGIKWSWFVIPVGVGLWYITVFQNFDAIKKIFMILSLTFVTYLITAVLSGADWGAVLKNTFVPQLDFNFNSISSAVAILGATISPYTMFWQVQGEKEEKRIGTTNNQVKTAALDIGSGVLSGNVVAYFIIVATSATLFTHHSQINTAADAARSLEPLAGAFAKYLFAAGLIGAGLVAIPVLLASTSYALSGTFNLPAGLSKKPWQNEGFYLILTVALVASLIVAMLGFDPIQLMFWANVLQAFLAPILILLIMLVGNSRKVMGKYRLSFFNNVGLVLTGLILIIAAGLLVFGLLTGQAGG